VFLRTDLSDRLYFRFDSISVRFNFVSVRFYLPMFVRIDFHLFFYFGTILLFFRSDRFRKPNTTTPTTTTTTMMNLEVIQRAIASIALLAASKSIVAAFTTPSESRYHPPLRVSTNQLLGNAVVDTASTVVDITSSSLPSVASTRRAFLTTSAVIFTSGNAILFPANAADGQDYVEPTTTTTTPSSSDTFESIAARAARVSQQVTESEVAQQIADEEASQRRQELVQKLKDDTRTIYDFTLPVNGKAREITELLGQTFSGGDSGDGWTDGGEGESSTPGRMNGGGVVGTRVKAILVVNMKQDDPIARKNIPELIELVTR
jgi:hypothetical protein